MPRARNAVASHKRKKKVFQRAKGFRGGRSKIYRTAKQSVDRALAYSYRDRRQRRRDFRRLWIMRINAATRLDGLSYSQFMSGLKKAGIDINRKMLADLAIFDPAAFSSLVEKARQAIA